MSSILRLLVLTVLFIGVTATIAPDAYGHGGQFRGPGDSVPPGLREPSDPIPPPPPPPPTSTTPTPVTPGTTPIPTAPTTPGVKPTPVPTPGTTGRPRPGPRATDFGDWTFWYGHNKAPIENLKWWLYHPMSSPNPLFADREDGGILRGGEMRYTEKKVLSLVIPALHWAMDPKNAKDPDVESAAYIALAKVTKEPTHIKTIMAGLDKEAKHDAIVEESAALALGLLRRAHREDQFTARELDKVRKFLFDVFEDDKYGVRTRGFAAISIGLLGDQPTGSGVYANDATAAARATTERLFDLLSYKFPNPDLEVSLLMAIGLQPSPSVTTEQRETLSRCALKGRLAGDKADELVRAHAALALGRIGTASDIPALENMLTVKRNVPHGVRRSAAIGLGTLGRLASNEARVKATNVLLRRLDRAKDDSTVNFGLISLAYLLQQDAEARQTAVLEGTKAAEYLLHTARKGKYLNRGFGALALGLVARNIDDDVEVEAWQNLREEALLQLRASMNSPRLDKKTRAAFCTALGIARDVTSREPLRKILADKGSDKMLRGYAALSLGLIGAPTTEVTRTVARALQERSSDELRRQSAVALGLMGNPQIPGTRHNAVSLLLEELTSAETQAHKGQIVLALSRVGDHVALDRLVELVKDPKEEVLTRALACAGLGLIGDLELLPSLARGSDNINYRAVGNTLREYLTIL
jgi:HEAT repeat protein